MKRSGLGIEAIEYYLPPDTITAKELIDKFGYDADFIENKVGIRQLYVAGDQAVSMIATQALEKLLVRKPELRESLDLLVVCTQTPDYQLPQVSSLIQSNCQLPTTVAAFDISLGCSGFVYGLSVVEAMMQQHGYNNAVLITAETYSKIIDEKDRNTKCLFSDAAAATLVSYNGAITTGKFKFGTNGDYYDRLIVKESESSGGESRLYMDGRAIFNFTVSVIPSEIANVCKLNEINQKSVDYFVLHQASSFVLDAIAKKAGISEPGRLVKYLHRFGNTVSSSIPIALKELLAENGKENLTILVSGFGVGLSWASTILHTKGDCNHV